MGHPLAPPSCWPNFHWDEKPVDSKTEVTLVLWLKPPKQFGTSPQHNRVAVDQLLSPFLCGGIAVAHQINALENTVTRVVNFVNAIFK